MSGPMSGTLCIIPVLPFFTMASNEKRSSLGGRLSSLTSTSFSTSESTSSQPDVDDDESDDNRTSDVCNALSTSMHSISFFGVMCSLFFSSSVADVALKARSLHESKQEIQIARTQGPWSRQIDWSNKNKNHNQTKNDDPQIPQPDLRFASGDSEANSRNKTKPTKRGQSPNKNTHRIDLPLDAVAYPLHHYQKHATWIRDHGCPGRHEGLSLGVNPFFSVQRRMASARSFNMFPTMLHLRLIN